MKQDNKTILKAIGTATAIGLFYGGLGASVMGGLCATVGTLVTALLTMFQSEGLWLLLKIGVLTIISGLIGTSIGYLLTYKADLKSEMKAMKDIMVPVMAIAGFGFMAILMFIPVIIYYRYVVF